jgi:hypothetical protein
MMGNWNEGESHDAYWLQKNLAQQRTLGDIRMTTWISMCIEVLVPNAAGPCVARVPVICTFD